MTADGSKLSPQELLAVRRAERMATLPISRVKLFNRVYAAKAPPRSAIKAFCGECLAFNEQDIRTCTAPACPLYEYRPYQRKG